MPQQKRITASVLATTLERAITAGELTPGASLPSVRALARERGVSPGTAAAAYAELKRRGVVVARPRSGMRVADRSRVASVVPPAVPAGVRDLRMGNPDPALLPDVARALRRIDATPGLYGVETVDPGLREVASAALEADGIDATHLCVLNGAMDAIERVLAVHLAPGDGVAVEDPGFPAVFDAARALGLRLVPMAGGRIPEGVRAAVITPRGQNPTGGVLDRRLRVPPGVLLIEDDHLGPAAGVPARTLSAGRERWAAVRSVSKWLGPDLRLAVLAGDADTVGRVAARQALGPGWVSTILQRTVAALWSDDDTLALAEQAATVYRGRREALIAALAAHGIAATGESGLNVWVPVPDEDAAATGLLAAGWAVTRGAPFRLESPPAIRITTAALRPAEAQQLAADLAAVLSPPSRTRAA